MELVKSDKWILRPAQFSDYDAVMSFHSQGTFESLDYMPATFHKMLHDKKSNAFTCTTVEGNVVGFVNYYLLDEETVGSVGVRVRDEHQGQGLMRWMCDQALRCVSRQYPTVRREAWCSQYLPYLQRQLENPASLTTADREAVWFIYKLTSTEISNFQESAAIPIDASHQIHKLLSLQETKILLSDDAVLEELFPENVFLVGVDWLPMKKTFNNLMCAAMQSHTYGSFDTKSGQCVGISLCYSSKSPYGSTHHFMFHGREVNVLLNHLHLFICHLSKIMDQGKGVALSLQFPVHPLEAKKQQVVDFLSPYFGEPRQSDTFSRHCVLAVSKPIQTNAMVAE